MTHYTVCHCDAQSLNNVGYVKTDKKERHLHAIGKSAPTIIYINNVCSEMPNSSNTVCTLFDEKDGRQQQHIETCFFRAH